jgi:hypothetical protein
MDNQYLMTLYQVQQLFTFTVHFKVPSQHSPAWTEKEPEFGQSAYHPRFEPGTSQLAQYHDICPRCYAKETTHSIETLLTDPMSVLYKRAHPLDTGDLIRVDHKH